jgi:hypothetical protein
VARHFDGFGIALPRGEASPGEADLGPFTNAVRRFVERLLDGVGSVGAWGF